MSDDIVMRPIGVIRTPYDEGFTPHQPVEREQGESRLELLERYADGLADLSRFRYVIVLFYMHRGDGEVPTRVAPPWAHGVQVGLFASRSPARPNPIGMSVVRLKRIEGSTVVTSAIDAHDGTPLLDVKPYIRGLDSKTDADIGWIEDLPGGGAHVLEHLRGVPHEHGHGHGEHDHHHHEGHDHHHDDGHHHH